MPTQAEQLIEEVRPLVQADVPALAGEAKWLVGPTAPDRRVAPPRVAWVEGDADFSRQNLNPGTTEQRQRAIWTRQREITAYVAGESPAQAEAIVDVLLQRLHEKYSVACRPVRETVEPRAAADKARLGDFRVLTLVVDLAVLDKPDTRALIETVD
ncbi:MAG TPA: hypothetical protein VFS43_22820, partial [Polyangiaceae bacterium]|nr:hypothetical protein [Polyangiaceae bacterium]